MRGFWGRGTFVPKMFSSSINLYRYPPATHHQKGFFMRLEVLVSCMSQEPFALIQDSRITSDVLIINQIGQVSEYSVSKGSRSVRIINTDQTGLSRSRNMAIRCAKGDICLLCDDDEVFVSGYEEIIVRMFSELPEADLIIFNMAGQPHKLGERIRVLRWFHCLKVSSWQITFRRKSVIQKNISFDHNMGAGTGNGGGEEVKFLLDCLKAGLKIYYVPLEIASVAQQSSTWFFGFDQIFFYQRGISTRYMLGLPLSVIYAFYYTLRKIPLYKDSISPFSALGYTLKGILKNDIYWQKREGNHGDL